MTGRDRLRELLDAVLDGTDEGTSRGIDAMAAGAHSSPFHFSRELTRHTGEAPASMRRRVLLERASWQLRHGAAVTETAFAAGYESLEGFSRAFNRAFGQAPSSVPQAPGRDWLPAPNGIHFHPPMALWVEGRPASGGGQVTALMVEHDLDQTQDLLGRAARLSTDDYRRVRLPDHQVLPWDGLDDSIAAALRNLVASKEVWLASIDGADLPDPQRPDDVATLQRRHDEVAPRWLSTIRDLDRRGAWDDRLVDALCDPPESFVMSSVVAHVLTYAAHRRHLLRMMLGARDHDDSDPINWLHHRQREEPPA